MNSKFNFGDAENTQTVYIRTVATETLPADIRDQLPGVETMYAVHDTDGERLALVQDRNTAFMLARQNELSPVSAH
nr:DUF1150 family protein [Paracoccus saliphilus]